MTRPFDRRNPLEGATQLLVDGTNLLHAMSRGPNRQPPAALIGRLRGIVPAETQITIVFDGPPERSIRGERIASGVMVRYGGRYSADTVLVTLVEDATMGTENPAAAAGNILVITNDRELREALHRRGARTAGAAWLLGRLERQGATSPGLGNARPPRPPRLAQQQPGQESADVPDSEADAASSGWRPGRGATTKRGNPRRLPRGSRDPNQRG